MLFDLPDGCPFALIDWQISTRGSGPAEIAYFLGASLDVDARRQGQGDLLARYHEGLLQGGVRDYPAETLWHDFRLGMAWIPFIVVAAIANVDVSMPRGQTLVDAYFERGDAALIDTNFRELLAD